MNGGICFAEKCVKIAWAHSNEAMKNQTNAGHGQLVIEEKLRRMFRMFTLSPINLKIITHHAICFILVGGKGVWEMGFERRRKMCS